MRGFANLLVCASESGNSAVLSATRLAVASGASITLAETIEGIPPGIREQLPHGWDVPQLVRTRKQAVLKRAAARVRRSGVTPKTVLLDGAPADALVREVERGEYDLLVVGAPGAGMIDSTLTTPARLVRDCPRPVLLARPPRRRRRPRVLVAVDTSALRDRWVDALTAKLIESALWFAEQIGGEVHVLHVWLSYGDGPMRRAGVSPAALREYHEVAQKEVLDELEKVIAPFRDRIAPSGVHVAMGDPRKMISAFAAEKRVDLIVIGTVARSGIAGRILGNTAEVLLGKLPCSMVVIRPDEKRDRPPPSN
jgi:nucleotide-binding universal stress UspA family protein